MIITLLLLDATVRCEVALGCCVVGRAIAVGRVEDVGRTIVVGLVEAVGRAIAVGLVEAVGCTIIVDPAEVVLLRE